MANLQESLAIQQADRLRTQKNVTAAYDVLLPYVSGPSPSVGARLALARVYKDSNFGEQAIQVLDGIMVSSPADADTLQQAVNIAVDLKRYERADVWMAEALRLQPQNPRLYMVQARLLRAQGDSTGAKRALETAQQLNRGLGQTELVPAPVARRPARRPFSARPSRPPRPVTGAVATATPVASLRPDRQELGRRVHGRVRTTGRGEEGGGPPPPMARPSQADVMSLDRPSLATPAVLTAQAGPVRATPPVQVAQANPLVPLRRPGGESSASTSVTAMTPPPLPGTPGAPSGSMSDNDPLSREIERELTSLKKSTAIIVDGGDRLRGRSGEIGSRPHQRNQRADQGPHSHRQCRPGSDDHAGDDRCRHDRRRSVDPAALWRECDRRARGWSAAEQCTATGIAFGMGLDWGRLSVDVGSTPAGLPAHHHRRRHRLESASRRQA